MKMENKRKTMKDNVLEAVALVICIFIFGMFVCNGGETPQNVIKTDTITVRDTVWKDTTIIEKELVPKIIVKKKVDTVYTKGGDTLQLITEQKRYDRSLVSDKDTCDLEIYTSGINTSLDSLKWRLKTHSVTNTIEITKYVERKRTFKDRIHFAPNVSFGYGIFSKKPDVYVGFGVNVDL